MLQPPLFDAGPLIEGLRYVPDVLTHDEESWLLSRLEGLPLTQAQYKAWSARRRTLGYGGSFDYDSKVLRAGPGLPDWLQKLAAGVAKRIGEPFGPVEHALITEYLPGTPLGWHRDVPDFEDILGISLGAPCRMRFRPYPPDAPRREDIVNLELAPRSVYTIRGLARWGWQHSVAPVDARRWSITFRTLRRPAGS